MEMKQKLMMESSEPAPVLWETNRGVPRVLIDRVSFMKLRRLYGSFCTQCQASFSWAQYSITDLFWTLQLKYKDCIVSLFEKAKRANRGKNNL
jgi:hypothetical protein